MSAAAILIGEGDQSILRTGACEAQIPCDVSCRCDGVLLGVARRACELQCEAACHIRLDIRRGGDRHGDRLHGREDVGDALVARRHRRRYVGKCRREIRLLTRCGHVVFRRSRGVCGQLQRRGNVGWRRKCRGGSSFNCANHACRNFDFVVCAVESVFDDRKIDAGLIVPLRDRHEIVVGGVRGGSAEQSCPVVIPHTIEIGDICGVGEVDVARVDLHGYSHIHRAREAGIECVERDIELLRIVVFVDYRFKSAKHHLRLCDVDVECVARRIGLRRVLVPRGESDLPAARIRELDVERLIGGIRVSVGDLARERFILYALVVYGPLRPEAFLHLGVVRRGGDICRCKVVCAKIRHYRLEVVVCVHRARYRSAGCDARRLIHRHTRHRGGRVCDDQTCALKRLELRIDARY